MKKYLVESVDKNDNTRFYNSNIFKEREANFCLNFKNKLKQCQPRQQNKPKTNEKKIQIIERN